MKGGNDFKLTDFYAGTPETFNPFYGAKDNGDIFDPDNLSSLKEHVLKQTDDKGVHFLMADGVSCITYFDLILYTIFQITNRLF